MQNEYLQPIIEKLEALALVIPLEFFVFLGMFIDEIFPPIPSLFLLIIAGAVAKTQEHNLFSLLVYLGLMGALGKTLGAWLLYIIGDKAEHFIIKHFGKVVGVTQKEIEDISLRLNKGWKDFVVLFFARAIAVFPTTPISLICGILKIDIKTYLISSFIGTWVRSMFFLYIGYAGLMNYKKLSGDWTDAEAIAQLIFIALSIGAFIFYKQRKNKKSV